MYISSNKNLTDFLKKEPAGIKPKTLSVLSLLIEHETNESCGAL